MMEGIWLAVAAAITALTLGALHWMPKRREPGRITRYVSGVACLFAGFCIWRLPLGDWQTPVGLACIIVAGGLAVVVAYQWDEIVKDRHKVEKVEDTGDDLY